MLNDLLTGMDATVAMVEYLNSAEHEKCTETDLVVQIRKIQHNHKHTHAEKIAMNAKHHCNDRNHGKRSHWDDRWNMGSKMFESGRSNDTEMSAKERRYMQKMDGSIDSAYDEADNLRKEANAIEHKIAEISKAISINDDIRWGIYFEQQNYIKELCDFSVKNYDVIDCAFKDVALWSTKFINLKKANDAQLEKLNELLKELDELYVALKTIRSQIYF